MCFVCTVYKCSDDKMVITERNHTPTKINSTETDVTTPNSKATANVKAMVDSNSNSTDVHAYTEHLTSNITTNTATPSTYIYQNVDSIPCLIIEGSFRLEVTYDNTTVICCICSDIHVLNGEKFIHFRNNI